MARIDDNAAAGDGIDVRLSGLRDFGRAVQHEVDGSVRPEAQAAFDSFAPGVCFGHGMTASGRVRDARERYYVGLDTGCQSMAQFVTAAGAMVAAVEEVARRYGDSDWFASATADDVAAVFTAHIPRRTGGVESTPRPAAPEVGV